MHLRLLLLLLLLLLNIASSYAPASAAARLDAPLMGWSTWESLAKSVSEAHILRNIDLLRRLGLQASGYKMIQIDDGWQQLNRNTGWLSRANYVKRPNNKLAPGGLPKMTGNGTAGCVLADPIKFPRGMKALGAQLKARGLQFGLYTSGTKFVCDAEAGFRAYYSSAPYANLRDRDAACFNQWGIDLLKLDACSPDSTATYYNSQTLSYWRGALNSNVILYNSRFGCMAKTSCSSVYKCPLQTLPKPNSALPAYCNAFSDLARTGPDIKPRWSSILGAISTTFGRGKVSKPGFWSDPDYLVPHASLLTFVERRAQFGMWCIVSAPLLISVELSDMDEETAAMLTTTMAIGVNQLYEGDAGDLRRKVSTLWEFQKRFKEGQTAVVVVNVGADISTSSFSRFNFKTWTPNMADFGGKGGQCRYLDVWTGSTGTLRATSQFAVYERDSLFLLVSECSSDEVDDADDDGTRYPTSTPTRFPTAWPTSAAPTSFPTATPTAYPSAYPTKQSTARPTKRGGLTPAPSTAAAAATPSPDTRISGGPECRMDVNSTTRAQCLAKSTKCNMKWSGEACAASDVSVDIGCKCSQYCAYSCTAACNRDPQCYWNTLMDQCFNRATEWPGAMIVTSPICYLDG